MKKRFFYSLVVAVVALLAVSCEPVEPNQIDAKNIYGLWGKGSVYMRFTDEVYTDDPSFSYGREWDEGEEIFESDLTPYGNGWFRWKVNEAELTEIFLMENGGAEIPKIYTVTKLTPDRLEYKDTRGNYYSFTKVTETNP